MFFGLTYIYTLCYILNMYKIYSSLGKRKRENWLYKHPSCVLPLVTLRGTAVAYWPYDDPWLDGSDVCWSHFMGIASNWLTQGFLFIVSWLIGQSLDLYSFDWFKGLLLPVGGVVACCPEHVHKFFVFCRVPHLFLHFPGWGDSVFFFTWSWLFHTFQVSSRTFLLGPSPSWSKVESVSSFGGFVVMQTNILLKKYWLIKNVAFKGWHA